MTLCKQTVRKHLVETHQFRLNRDDMVALLRTRFPSTDIPADAELSFTPKIGGPGDILITWTTKEDRTHRERS